jgi:hypothetical protein
MGCSSSNANASTDNFTKPPSPRPAFSKSDFDTRKKAMGYSSVVNVSVGCTSLYKPEQYANLNPFCVAYVHDNESNVWFELSRSEVIPNSKEVIFEHKFRFNYIFEENQRIRFDMFSYNAPIEKRADVKNANLPDHVFLGCYELTLGHLMGTPNFTLHNVLLVNGLVYGEICLYGEEEDIISEELRLFITLQHTTISLTRKNLYIELYQMYDLLGCEITPKLCYKSNSSNNGVLNLDLQPNRICDGDFNKTFKLCVMEAGVSQNKCLGQYISFYIHYILVIYDYFHTKNNTISFLIIILCY